MDASPALRRTIIATTLTQGLTLEEVLADERALETFVMEGVITGYHAAGTCRMGAPTDPMTVCDPSWPDRRIDQRMGRRCLAHPELPRTNINLPTIMIAERSRRCSSAARVMTGSAHERDDFMPTVTS
jgi:5-(hydroxymethyl)furfural/furfural oxidase